VSAITWIKTIVLSISIIVAGYFISNIQKNGKEFDRSVMVKGLSERQVEADLAVWPISITLMGNDLVSLKAEIDRQSSEVRAFFKTLGFSNEEFRIGSANITDVRANLYGSDNPNREFHFIANADFTLRSAEIFKVQGALSKSLGLISKGILMSSKNSWRPIEYSFSGLNDLKPTMIEEATKNAREVAEKFAQDSNSKVSKIKSAQQGIFSISDLDENTAYLKIVRIVSTIEYQLKD
jgi:hypothetical protein